MLAELTTWIIESIRHLGWVGVFIGVIIESIIVPIPSPVIVMFAGFVMIEPSLALLPAIAKIFLVITIPASIAGLIGNYVVYWVAYIGGKPLVEKFEKYLGFSWKDVISIRKKFRIAKSETISLIILRAIPIMPLSLVSGAAGVIKLDWKKYGIASFIGMLIRNTILAFLGWKIGEVYFTIAEKIDHLESFMTLTIIGLAVIIFLAYRFKLIEKLEKWVTK
jgi:membrane protein DedA with SNARE-associated domain